MPTVNMSPKLCVLPPSVCRRAVISFDDNLADPPKFGLCFISVTSVLGASDGPPPPLDIGILVRLAVVWTNGLRRVC